MTKKERGANLTLGLPQASHGIRGTFGVSWVSRRGNTIFNGNCLTSDVKCTLYVQFSFFVRPLEKELD